MLGNPPVIATDWVGTAITAVAALLAAIVGGVFVLLTAKDSLLSATKEAKTQRDADREAANQQFRRELLSKATDRLLDALWTKERELCEALHQCRVAAQHGQVTSPDDPALKELGRLELAVYQDMISSLPFIHDKDLRERMRSAAQMVNDCYNLRAVSTPDTVDGGSVAVYERAMIEVQAYFKWLRWNLALALQGDPLPPLVKMPQVRRPENETAWLPPPGIPPWT